MQSMNWFLLILAVVLTLALGIDIRYAIGASIVSVIATSSGAAAAYVKEHMTNLRVAMWLETATTAGALSGAYLAGVIPTRALYIVFAVVLGYSAWVMFVPQENSTRMTEAPILLSELMRLMFLTEATACSMGLVITSSMSSGLAPS